jgi:hypothetical protein
LTPPFALCSIRMMRTKTFFGIYILAKRIHRLIDPSLT